MKRRDFCKASSLAFAGLAGSKFRPSAASVDAAREFPKAPGLTKYVSEFIVGLK